MDKELLQAASSAVQAQENLLALLKSKISESSVEPSAKEGNYIIFRDFLKIFTDLFSPGARGRGSAVL